jgi:hypothetical protein
VAQWDDDDWYHPDRLAEQVAALGRGEAVVLTGTLVHVAAGEWRRHPYLGWLAAGVPGTIVHRLAGAPRYPEVARAEDSDFLGHYRRRGTLLGLAGREHLFIRCYHGGNTWELDHFRRRLRNRPRDLLAWLWWAGVRRQPFRHPRFRLGAEARASFARYLEESAALGLGGAAEAPCA